MGCGGHATNSTWLPVHPSSSEIYSGILKSFIASLTTVQLVAEDLVLGSEGAIEKFESECLWLGVISNYK